MGGTVDGNCYKAGDRYWDVDGGRVGLGARDGDG